MGQLRQMDSYLDEGIALHLFHRPKTILLSYSIKSGSCRSERARSAGQVPLRIVVQQTTYDGSKAVSILAISPVLLYCLSLSVYEYRNCPILISVLLLDGTAANERSVCSYLDKILVVFCCYYASN